jgi:serine/threonine protein kinase/DNA-binding winged helix-turn-helix (wHTH) protein
MKNYAFDAFRFEVAKKQLWHNSELIPLQPKVAEMLTVFLENNGELVSREDLMREVWKDTFVEETNLRFCIHSLRKVLGKNSGGKDYIETVPRRGYRFTGEIEDDDAENSIGRYKILEKIGVGGMGEVFLAHDPQLDRKVALKVLLPQVAQDDERIRRFKLEAKAVSALNHPNIVTIFDVGESKDKIFIAYEFIEGETLREKIRRNKLTVADSINIAEQVAKALAVAHQSNIIHRDIKPENIMLRDDGYVKILDFGLAKRSAFASTNEEETLEWVKTQKGVIMGSVQYMSPEQSRGVETDERTDIWSLGVVLYEMLTGKNPFEGETISDSVASILNFEPKSIGKYLQSFPSELREIIEKALQKDLVHRYQNIKDFAVELKKVRRKLNSNILTKRIILDSSQAETVQFEQARITDEKNTFHQNNQSQPSEISVITPERKIGKWRKKWILIPAAVLVGGIILFGSYNLFHPFLFPNYYVAFKNPQITRLSNDGVTSRAAISDDKKWIAFVRKINGKDNLIARELATGNERIIESNSNEQILQPTFAPPQKYFLGERDFEDLYFVKRDKTAGTLYRANYKDDDYRKGLSVLPNVDSRINFSPDGNKFAFVREKDQEGSSVIVSPTNLYDDRATVTEKLSSKNTKLTKFENVAWHGTGEDFSVMGKTEYGDKSGSGETFETADIGSRHINGDANQVEWVKGKSRFFLGGTLYFDTPIFYYGYREISSEAYQFTSFDSTPDAKAVVISAETRYPSLWTYDFETKENKQIQSENLGIDNVGSFNLTADNKILLNKTKLTDPEKINIINRDEERDSDKKQEQITSIKEDGTNETLLFQCEDECSSPLATADDKYILYNFNSYNNELKEKKGIWRINSDGSNPLQLTGGSDYVFSTTADGQIVIFTRSDNNDTKLMKVSINGGESVEIANSPGGIGFAQDGKNIVFTINDKTESKLMKVSLDGGHSTLLAMETKSNGSISNPQFIKNGEEILYMVSKFDEETSKYNSKLQILSLNQKETGKPIWESNFDGFSFKVSPDGKWICYLKQDGLYRLALKSDAQPEQSLQFADGSVWNYSWSNEGNKIIYLLNSKKTDIFLIEDVE